MGFRLFFVFFHLLFFCLFPVLGSAGAENLQSYIVQLHPHEATASSGDAGEAVFASKMHWHLSFLEKSVAWEREKRPSSRLLYSYRTVFDGFAAQLTEEEAAALRELPGVASVRADRRVLGARLLSDRRVGAVRVRRRHRTDALFPQSNTGSDTIIGVLDTGVWPENPSFDDRGMPPVPARWQGVCQGGEHFNATNCNRKLIGARFYSKGHRANYPTNPSDAVSLMDSDILAGMDDAVRDGVDVLSLSLGGFPIPLFEDSIAIGSFRATTRGVSVVCAAGNNGPSPSSVANEAPWVITVGAGTLDRRFPAYVRLGNGRILYGESMFPGKVDLKNGGKELELVYAASGTREEMYCIKGALSAATVAGKMVVCDRGITGRADKGEAVKQAGGAAMILANSEINQEEDSVDVHVLPSTLIGYREAVELKNYVSSTRRPVARIVFGGTRIGRARAPAVALFSARGPSLTNPSVLKPDVVAPGVNIIAAWPGNLGPSGLEGDARRSDFTVLSGTSMACPHVSGIAALIRSAHPSWSPAMVRSAIMTTADVTDRQGKPIMDGNGGKADAYAMGAGHVNPARAVDPGLVYDIDPADYVTHLCNLGYTHMEIFKITHAGVNCTAVLERNAGFSLNYPSISVAFKTNTTSAVLQRTVTNVGTPNSTYTAQVAAPHGVRVRVSPATLTFSEFGEKKSFRVAVAAPSPAPRDNAEGYLVWKQSGEQGKRRVRSPIAVTWVVE
uniref:Subtilisin-like protease n=1 Tax=Oryza barthii TaxID=65489 RepID=A0A0D3FDN6_9ORYZ